MLRKSIFFTEMNKTTCLADPLPTKNILKISRVIIPLYLSIINVCLAFETFLSAIKSAIVNPLLKKSILDADQMSNYRPFSHLPFISKVIEKVIRYHRQ